MLNSETGSSPGHGDVLVGLGYPAPYEVAASSLGYLTVARVFNRTVGLRCERFFTDMGPKGPYLLESGAPVDRARMLAFSVACETELAQVSSHLVAARLAPLARNRGPADPPVVIGGPITMLDPRLVAPFADAVVHGDGEAAVTHLASVFAADPRKEALLDELDPETPGLWIPTRHDDPPPFAHAPDDLLPARAGVWSSMAELKDLYLIEAARGCSRGCAFCVLSGRACRGRGIRPVGKDDLLRLTPAEAPGVGLVGAAVSDHPDIVEIVEAFVDRGQRVSLSSLRADRLSPALMEALVRGGLKSLTLAADGSTEAIRRSINKGVTADHLRAAARAARDEGVGRLKIYSMLGLPGEQDSDVEEMASLLLELADIMPVFAAVQAFVPKPNTPLADAPMAPVRDIRRRLDRLRSLLGRRVRLAPTSPRWSWVDWKLAHMGARAAEVAIEAAKMGGTHDAWKKAVLAAGEKK